MRSSSTLETNQTDLYTAMSDFNFDRVKKLILENPKCLSEPDQEEGYYPLHYAVIAGVEELIEFMLSKNADINSVLPPRRKGDKITSLYLVAQEGDENIARLLLTHGADYENVGSKPLNGGPLISPLAAAAHHNHMAVVEVLLEYPHSLRLIQQAWEMAFHKKNKEILSLLSNVLFGRIGEKINNRKPLNLPDEQNIPKLVHFIYFNEIPREYIFGGKKNSGLVSLCEKAYQDGYQVILWVPDRNQFYQQYRKMRPLLDASLDANVKIAPHNLNVQNIDELDVLIDAYFSTENKFDSHFSNDLKTYINSEKVKNFNLAAASNLLRLVILTLYGGIYCDLSKTFAKEHSLKNFHFDHLTKQMQFGFSQYENTNFFLASYQAHPVLIETLAFILKNYRTIYNTSFNYFKHKSVQPLYVMKGQGKIRMKLFPTKDPLQYTRSQHNADYRESSTETLSGIFPIMYGKMKYVINYYTYFNPNITYTICYKNRIDCTGTAFYQFYYSNNLCVSGVIADYCADIKKLIEEGKLPSTHDWSIYPYPLGLQKEKVSKKNWRELPKVYHDEESIFLLFKGVKSNKTPKEKTLHQPKICRL